MAAPQFFRLSDFSGGLNPQSHPTAIADNQASDILNFRLDNVGSLVSRNGLTHITAWNRSSDVIQMGVLREPTSLATSKPVLHASDGWLWHVSTGDNDSYAIDSGFGTTKGKFLSAKDTIIYANGERIPVLWDGTNSYDLGYDAPNAPVVSASIAGTLDGTYYYRITYYNSTLGYETNASEPDDASPTNDGVSITWTTSTIHDKVRIYRLDPGQTVYQFLAEVDVDSAPYGDDGSVSLTPIAAPEDNNKAGDFECMAFYQGTYFGSIGRELYWSNADDPFTWPGLFFTEVPFEGNDSIVALVAYQDSLLIFGKQNILVLTGTGFNVNIARLDTSVGLISPDGVLEIEGQVVFLALDGLRVFPGLQPLAPQLQQTLLGEPLIHKEAAIISYSVPEKAVWLSIGNKTYVIFLPSQAVSVYDFVPRAVLSGGVTGEGYNWLGLGNKVYENIGETDDGESISVRWHSKIFFIGNPEGTKFLRRLGMFATEGTATTVTVTITDASRSYSVVPSATGTEGIPIWEDDGDAGTSLTWDDFVWPSEGVQYYIAALPGHTLSGQTVQLKIGGTVDAAIQIVPPITVLYREAIRFLGR